MKKILFIVMVFACFSNKIVAKDEFNYSFKEIQLMKKGFAPYVIKYCKDTKNVGFKECFKYMSKKIQKTFSLAEVKNGDRLLRYCYDDNVKNVKPKDVYLDIYIDCVNILKEGLAKKTAYPELNHLFLIDKEVHNSILFNCRNKYVFNTNKINECIRDNKESSKDFIFTFFTRGKRAFEYEKVKKCIPKHKKEINGNIIFDYDEIMKCIKY